MSNNNNDGWEWVGMGIFVLCLGIAIGGCEYLDAKSEAIKADTKAKKLQLEKKP